MLVATHFKDLITSEMISSTPDRLSVGSMEVLSQPSKAHEATSELVYLYRLTSGTLASESHAIRCASLAGVRAEVLRRAFQVQSIVSMADSEGTIDENLIDSSWTAKVEAEEQAFRKFQALNIECSEDVAEFLEEL